MEIKSNSLKKVLMRPLKNPVCVYGSIQLFCKKGWRELSDDYFSTRVYPELVEWARRIFGTVIQRSLLIYFILLALATGAIFLRFFKLGSQSYWMDEGYTVNAVLSVIQKGKTILDSGQYYSCTTYCYPTAFFANIFGLSNPASYRALAAIAGVIFILAFFLIVRSLFKNKNNSVALLSTFFVAFSYWQIVWSREARWYTLLELFFWLAIFFFWQTINAKKFKPETVEKPSVTLWFDPESFLGRTIHNFSTAAQRAPFGARRIIGTVIQRSQLVALNLTLTILWTVLAILTHSEAYLLLPIFVAWTVYTFLTNKSLQPKKKKYVIFGLILFAVILALVTYHFGQNFLKPLLASLHFHYTLSYYLSFYFRNYWLFIPFAIWAVTTCNKYNRSLTAYLLTSLLAYFLSFGLLSDLVHYRYLFIVTPVLYILATYGIVQISKQIRHKLWRVVFFCIIIFIFFASGQGVLWPKNFYALESDDPSEIRNRPYYAYTPQANFNEAFSYVKENKSQEEIVVSSHPAFNKIFLGEAGYWLKYAYLGVGDNVSYISQDNREYYVGAKVIGSQEELQKITEENHGYIIFDYYSTQDRIPKEEIDFIRQDFQLVFQKDTSSYSKIWVYQF